MGMLQRCWIEDKSRCCQRTSARQSATGSPFGRQLEFLSLCPALQIFLSSAEEHVCEHSFLFGILEAVHSSLMRTCLLLVLWAPFYIQDPRQHGTDAITVPRQRAWKKVRHGEVRSQTAVLHFYWFLLYLDSLWIQKIYPFFFLLPLIFGCCCEDEIQGLVHPRLLLSLSNNLNPILCMYFYFILWEYQGPFLRSREKLYSQIMKKHVTKLYQFLRHLFGLK